jgi:hypothetical protein
MFPSKSTYKVANILNIQYVYHTVIASSKKEQQNKEPTKTTTEERRDRENYSGRRT